VLASGRPAIILRPHAVYGQSDNTLLPRLKAAVRPGGKLVLPAGANVNHAMTSLENLTQAVVLAVQKVMRPDYGEQIALNVCDANAVNLADAINAVLDEPVKIIAVPNWLALIAARWVELLTPAGTEPRFSRYAVRQLGYERTYDLGATIEVLGFAPQPNSLLPKP